MTETRAFLWTGIASAIAGLVIVLVMFDWMVLDAMPPGAGQ